MPSFTGNPFSNFYKRILQISQPSNTGVTTVTKTIQDGEGNSTAISLSDDQFIVRPQDDNTTSTMIVANGGGDNILAVDTTNSLVKVGGGQVSATTQLKEFTTHGMTPVAGNHHLLIANPSTYFGQTLSEE